MNDQHEKTFRILLVDDTEQIRRIIIHFLNRLLRCDIYQAVDGLDGIEKMLEVKPDLIITDIVMPRMNGLEFLGFVNQHESQQDVPVIVLTSQDDENTFLQALKLNIVAFLPKPFQPESLMEILRDVVPRQHFLEDQQS